MYLKTVSSAALLSPAGREKERARSWGLERVFLAGGIFHGILASVSLLHVLFCTPSHVWLLPQRHNYCAAIDSASMLITELQMLCCPGCGCRGSRTCCVCPTKAIAKFSSASAGLLWPLEVQERSGAEHKFGALCLT